MEQTWATFWASLGSVMEFLAGLRIKREVELAFPPELDERSALPE